MLMIAVWGIIIVFGIVAFLYLKSMSEEKKCCPCESFTVSQDFARCRHRGFSKEHCITGFAASESTRTGLTPDNDVGEVIRGSRGNYATR